jgi:hypothetical protein
VSCRQEHVAPINQLVKELFCFQPGSEWVYYDSVSQSIQRMVVINYEIFKSAPKSMRKAYNFAEYIEMNISVENIEQAFSVTADTYLLADIEQDNTLMENSIFTPTIKYLVLSCDKNNNFTPSATYLSTYSVNETTYSDVYIFNNKDDITYFIAKHIGFIRCIKDNEFDFKLIDKKVFQ